MPFKARAMLQTIVIVGDGQVGLAAAIALRRALPRADIVVTACTPDPSALADRTSSSQPRTNAFHARIGLEEKAIVLRCGGSHRLASRFLNWRESGPSYLHAYGAHSASGLSVTQALADANRFALPSDDSESPLSDIDYAMRFDQRAYRNLLAAFAQHLGIKLHDSRFVDAVREETGDIGHISLANGTHLSADLFIDCTGPQRLLSNAGTRASFEDWSAVLPCSHVILTHRIDEPVLSVTDSISAHDWGWQSSSFGRDGTQKMAAFNADLTRVADIFDATGEDRGGIVPIAPGRLKHGWIGNVVAFGDAAAAFEPLQYCNLLLAHEQILLFLELLPGQTFDGLERAEYNRRSGAMADRIRDYIALHHCGSSTHDGAFWKYAAALDRPDSLMRTFSEFGRRGRLPFFEEDILPRDAWLSTMECIGVPAGLNAHMLALPDKAVMAQQDFQQTRTRLGYEQSSPYAYWLESYIRGQA